VYDQPIIIEKVVEPDEKSQNDVRGSKVRKVDSTGNIIVEDSEEMQPQDKVPLKVAHLLVMVWFNFLKLQEPLFFM
jgi:hypothetical protein